MTSKAGKPTSRSEPDAFDAISWQIADEATRRLALETLEAVGTKPIVEQLAARYVNSQDAHRAGHMFEVMHSLSFNQDAIHGGSGVRAVVTEWEAGGSQTDPSDIDIVSHGQVIDEAQAKLYDGVSATAHQLARDHYDGMQRLVAADRYKAVEALLDRKVKLHPDGINTEHFKDAHAHVTATLHEGAIHSDPVTYQEAQHAAHDPNAWINDEVREAAAHEALVGMAASGGTSAVIGALASAAQSTAKVRSGDMTAVEAAITACAAAGRTAARSTSAAGIGEAFEVAAQTGHLVDGLAGGTLPFAMGRATVAIAEAGYAYAQGEIDEAEFAARTARATAQTSIVWAFASVGQTVIPIPVVGAMAGAFVGQLVGVQCIKGLQTAIIAVRADAEDTERLVELELQLLAATALTEELSELAAELGADRNSYLTTHVMPKVSSARRSLLVADTDRAFEAFATVIRSFGGQPIFTTVDEFDRWMADPGPFRLDGNWN